jgi:hypothetical protein
MNPKPSARPTPRPGLAHARPAESRSGDRLNFTKMAPLHEKIVKLAEKGRGRWSLRRGTCPADAVAKRRRIARLQGTQGPGAGRPGFGVLGRAQWVT